MAALVRHWTFDPVLVVIALIVVVHARGLRLRHVAMRRAGRSTTPWIWQAVLFWLSLVILVVAICSPIDYYSGSYLTSHIIQHIMLSFFAPPLLVIGAPWLPLLRGLPRSWRAWLGRLAQRTRMPGSGGSVDAELAELAELAGAGPVTRAPGAAAYRVLAWVRRVASRPVTSVVAFNIAMLFWHLPGPYDLAETNEAVHIWLEHGSFFLLGLALWLQIFGSYPLRPLLPGPRRIGSLLASNAVMVVVAMSLVMFAHDPYAVYNGVHSAYIQHADQQIGGAILWVCGEITFMPSILYTMASWLREREPMEDEPLPGMVAGPSVTAA